MERRLSRLGAPADVARDRHHVQVNPVVAARRRKGPRMRARQPRNDSARARQRATPRSSHDVSTIIIGAGPYGLAAAAHLRDAGADPMIFGIPMDFWENHMPEGMHLRSPRDGSSI